MFVYVNFLVTICLFAYSESAIHLEINPSIIEIGFTNTFVIECAVSENPNPKGVHITSIILSRTNQTSSDDFTDLASINIFSTQPHDLSQENALVQGYINGTIMAYLSMTWANPSYDKAGLYRCEATGIDEIGHHYGYVSTSNVSVEEPDYESFKLQIEAMNDILSLIDSDPTLKRNLRLQLENSKLAYFEASTTFNNSRYFLSSNYSVLTASRCQATCQMYGGYLAEINSAAEFTFIRDFIRRLKNTKRNLQAILIGGTDEGHEKTWISTDSNLHIEYLDFTSGQNTGSTSDNCIYLNENSDWRMDDLPCIIYKTYLPRFLCEFPKSD